jgi:uncharacterized protein with PIN domain
VKLRLRFEGELNDLAPPDKRNVFFEQSAGPTDTLKHVIESLGVPHTEIGRVLVNGQAADLSEPIQDDSHVQVFPHETPIRFEAAPAFVVDGHLGRLAAYLRMLGFDTWYQRSADDPQLASVSSNEHRILLTRDVGLLKRKEVQAGYLARSDRPLEQASEVARRFALQTYFAPFTRCMECNGRLVRVAKAEVADLLPPHTRETKNEFSRCTQCGRIFWRGSHHARMLKWVETLTEGKAHYEP